MIEGDSMYEKMYYILFRAVTDAMVLIENREEQNALLTLEEACREAEEVYISQ